MALDAAGGSPGLGCTGGAGALWHIWSEVTGARHSRLSPSTSL